MGSGLLACNSVLLGEWCSGVSKDCVAFRMSAASHTAMQNHIPEDWNPQSLSECGTHIILFVCNADIFYHTAMIKDAIVCSVVTALHHKIVLSMCSGSKYVMFSDTYDSDLHDLKMFWNFNRKMI